MTERFLADPRISDLYPEYLFSLFVCLGPAGYM